jgi:8-oxo-dGTP pyrophosphatase MutT (NUDIX family)
LASSGSISPFSLPHRGGKRHGCHSLIALLSDALRAYKEKSEISTSRGVAMTTAPVTPVPAATLMLLRDGPDGLEVLMTARHDAAGFAAGAMVFPGGKLDAGDRDLLQASPTNALDERSLALRIAAIRETFEECGLLLARAAPGETMLSHAAAVALLEAHADAAGFGELVSAARLELATDLLVPFAHWITPADRPKRFDTHFFLAPAPADQVAKHDGREAVETRWITPQDAIAAADQGRLKLVIATRMNLLKLDRARSVAAAFEAAQRSEVVTVEPRLVETAAGPAFSIPAAADYGVTEMPVGKTARA